MWVWVVYCMCLVATYSVIGFSVVVSNSVVITDRVISVLGGSNNVLGVSGTVVVVHFWYFVAFWYICWG